MARRWSSQLSAGVIVRTLIAQPIDKLDCEGLRQRLPLVRASTIATDSAGRRLRPASGRPRRRLVVFGPAVGDLSREASEILDHDDPQRDRDGPEFADRQRLDLLIRCDEATQHPGIEAAIGMGDEGPGDPEYPRVASERPTGELRELPIVARRQIRMDLMDLLFDEVIIVDQPLCCGRYRASVIDRPYGRTVGEEQSRLIVGKSSRQRLSLGRPGRYDLRNGQAARMILKPLNAEQFLANWALAVPL